MPTYIVQRRRRIVYEVEVKASCEKSALKKASRLLDNKVEFNDSIDLCEEVEWLDDEVVEIKED